MGGEGGFREVFRGFNCLFQDIIIGLDIYNSQHDTLVFNEVSGTRVGQLVGLAPIGKLVYTWSIPYILLS